MPSSRTNSSAGRDELLLALEPGVGRRRGLEQALRQAIREGRVAVGERLPPTRVLARDLGVSRGTVVEAYEQLVAEGYLSARQGSGTAVARAAAAPSPPQPAAVAEPLPRYSFHPGVPDPTAFPADQWVRALRRALRGVRPERLGYQDSRGTPELRYVLASYLARARGVVGSPELVVTCSGFVRGLGLLCGALRGLGAKRLGIENPTIPLHREVAAAAGLELVQLDVDEHGVLVEQVEASRADAVLVTPAHQFPLGSTLSPERRAALVEWARRTGGFVIEDDYDGEFRYDRQPVGALQALDPERVVYAGTASKTLAPGMRLAWLVLPPTLVEPVAAVKRLGERQLPFTEELALAELIESGDWDRHLRRMRSRFRTRRDRLIEMLAKRVPDARALGIAAGLHAVVELPADGPSEDELLARARERSVDVFALGRFWHEPRPLPKALVVGYASPPEHRFAVALRALGDVLADSG